MTREYASRHVLLSAALMVLGLMPGTSRADIVFTQDSVKTDVNLGDFVQVDGNTVNALNLNANNQLGQGVPILQIDTFVSKGGAEVAIQPHTSGGGGQAFIETVSPAAEIGYAVFTAINPPYAGFTQLEFNPFDDTKQAANSQFYLVATDGSGVTFTSKTFTFDANGENRVAASALNGQIITKLEFVNSPASADILKQFRVTGVVAVPEASTMTMAALVGSIPLGLAGLRRLRRGAVNTSA